jgi:energy-coupling factor transport system substrate-specific component
MTALDPSRSPEAEAEAESATATAFGFETRTAAALVVSTALTAVSKTDHRVDGRASVRRDPVVIPLGRWSRLTLVIAGVLGAMAFFWPFLLAPDVLGDVSVAPLLFGVLLILVVFVGVAQLAEGGIDAKALALLGVLSAVNAGLRPLGLGTSGVELVFFLLVLAGRAFGPGFGFLLGCTSLFASAIITGGVGPWLPYQMFGAAFIGLGAGLLPRCRARAEIVLLATYGFVSGYLYGLLLNLSFWPFVVDPGSTTAYVPGAANWFNLRRYVIFDSVTSLGWDTLRALTNVILIVLTGPAVLAALRRAGRRAAFEAPVEFAPADPGVRLEGEADVEAERVTPPGTSRTTRR